MTTHSTSVSKSPVISPLNLKKLAKSLSIIMAREGVAIPHHKAIEVTSKLIEEKSWNVFLARAESRSGGEIKARDNHFEILHADSYFLLLRPAVEMHLKALIEQCVAQGAERANALDGAKFIEECERIDQSTSDYPNSDCAAPTEQLHQGTIVANEGVVIGAVMVGDYPVLVTKDWAMRQNGIEWANVHRWREIGWSTIVDNFIEVYEIDMKSSDKTIFILNYGMVTSDKNVPMAEYASAISHLTWNGRIQINTFAFVEGPGR